MEDILMILLQFFFEFVLEILLNIGTIGDWPVSGSSAKARSSAKSPTLSTSKSIFPSGLLWFIIGCVVAGLSVSYFKYTLISLPSLRIVNLVLAPIVAAYLSQAISARRSVNRAFVVPRKHFWWSFWFTLGLVTVRFAYAQRYGGTLVVHPSAIISVLPRSK